MRCRVCMWFKPLLFPIQGKYRDGYCAKRKCYINSTDTAEKCEHFRFVGMG
jgi:hypothetical protein